MDADEDPYIDADEDDPPVSPPTPAEIAAADGEYAEEQRRFWEARRHAASGSPGQPPPATQATQPPTPITRSISMNKGIDGLLTPYSKSQFQQMVEEVRAHHNAAHDQYSTVAATLRAELQKVTGAPGLFGLDVRMAARRVTRPLVHCAGLEQDTAKALMRSLDLFNELFLGRSPAHTKGFDITK